MALENNPYPFDVRVRSEAETLARAGHRVTVIAPRAPRQVARETIAGVEVRRFRLPPDRAGAAGLMAEYAIAHVALLTRVLRLLIAGADVVHVHNPPDSMAIAFAVTGRLGRRSVFDNHDLMDDLFALRFGRGRAWRAIRAIQRYAFGAADIVITSNQSQRDAVLATGRSPDDVVVVRNGPPRAMLRDVVPARPPGQGRRPLLAYCGILGPQDGVEGLPYLLSALERRHGLLADLLVVGDGSQRVQIEARAADLGVSERFHVTGIVSHDGVAQALSEADVCVDPTPSTPFNDSCTMVKIGEYLACGKPTVSFPLPETVLTAADAVRYARLGDLDDFADQVAALLRDPRERNALAQRGRARAEILVWEHSERELLQVYGRLANQHGKRKRRRRR